MEPWQKVINNRLKSAIIEIARQLKQQNPGHGIGLNYKIHYPDYFVPGEDTNIPITVPSHHGPFHIADAMVSVNDDQQIVDIGIYMYKNPGLFDETVTVSRPSSVADGLSKISNFLSEVNSVLFGDAMKSLLSFDPDVSMSFGNIATGHSRPRFIGAGTKIPVQGGGMSNWKSIRANNINAEVARASKITTEAGRKEFITESLESPSKAPHWFWALGGKQKSDAKDKVVDAYLDACKSVGKTIAPSMFFEKLQRSMAQRQQLMPYCERDNRKVSGTVDGECLNRSCSEYSPSCPKFSYRINTSSYGG